MIKLRERAETSLAKNVDLGKNAQGDWCED